MKSEQEIKEMIRELDKKLEFHIELGHGIEYEKYKEMKYILLWVLEDSKPKRTIFDLTIKELKELCEIVIPRENFMSSFINQMQINEEFIFFCYTKYWKTENNKKEEISYFISLDINTDIDVELFGELISLKNITKYSNRIREMLREPIQLLSNPKQLEGQNI